MRLTAPAVEVALGGHEDPARRAGVGQRDALGVGQAGAAGEAQRLARRPAVGGVAHPLRAIPQQSLQPAVAVVDGPEHARGPGAGALVVEAADVAAEDSRPGRPSVTDALPGHGCGSGRNAALAAPLVTAVRGDEDARAVGAAAIGRARGVRWPAVAVDQRKAVRQEHARRVVRSQPEPAPTSVSTARKPPAGMMVPPGMASVRLSSLSLRHEPAHVGRRPARVHQLDEVGDAPSDSTSLILMSVSGSPASAGALSTSDRAAAVNEQGHGGAIRKATARANSSKVAAGIGEIRDAAMTCGAASSQVCRAVRHPNETSTRRQARTLRDR